MTFRSIAILAAFAGLAACAGTETEREPAVDLSDPRVGDEVDRICFTSGIDGFTNPTDRSVVLSRGLKDYLVTTNVRCRDLRDAMSVAVDTYSGCLTRGDKLIGFDSVFGGNIGDVPSFPCYVDKMYEWDRDAETPVEDTGEGTDDNEPDPDQGRMG